MRARANCEQEAEQERFEALQMQQESHAGVDFKSELEHATKD